MKFIYNENLNPYYNLAAEEYLVKNTTDEIFMVWQNDNTIVVGKNQNTLAEINYDYVKENNINVVRRMSGGGTVFHDLGNINFTFILNSDKDFSNYEKFTTPIIDFLGTLGIKAELAGRNDLAIDGKKISGNAQFMYKNRILHHGTLLYSSEKNKIAEALSVSEDKISSKGIKSVKSRVTNISSYISEKMSAKEFLEKLSDFIKNNTKDIEKTTLSVYEEEIKKLAREKYMTWEWNFGYSPKYAYTKKERFSSGGVEVLINVSSNGIIDDIKIFGDFFSKKPIEELEERLKGHHHEQKELFGLLSEIDVSEYISGITRDEFMMVLF